MSEYVEVDPQLPENEEYVLLFDHLIKGMTERVNTWKELTEFVTGHKDVYLEDPGPATANSALMIMTAYLLALSEFPEEGDCTVIRDEMVRIAVFRPDLTGFDVLQTLQASKVRAVGSALVHALATILAEPDKAPEVSEESAPSSTAGRTLH